LHRNSPQPPAPRPHTPRSAAPSPPPPCYSPFFLPPNGGSTTRRSSTLFRTSSCSMLGTLQTGCFPANSAFFSNAPFFIWAGDCLSPTQSSHPQAGVPVIRVTRTSRLNPLFVLFVRGTSIILRSFVLASHGQVNNPVPYTVPVPGPAPPKPS